MAVILIPTNTKRFLLVLIADNTHKRLKIGVLEVDFLALTPTYDARFFRLSLEDDLDDRLCQSVPSVLDLPDIVVIVEDPASADATIGTVLSEANPVSKIGIWLPYHHLHGLESIVDIIDTVIYSANSHTWRPLSIQDLTVIDPATLIISIVVLIHHNMVCV